MSANDGVVPVRSQIWGKLIWAGFGDHLDVVGHFRDSVPAADRDPNVPAHVDWLYSGSSFDRERFASLSTAIANGILASAKT